MARLEDEKFCIVGRRKKNIEYLHASPPSLSPVSPLPINDLMVHPLSLLWLA